MAVSASFQTGFSQVITDSSTTNNDNSLHQTLQTGPGQTGNTVSLSGSQISGGLNLIDPGTVAASQAIAVQALQSNQAASASLAADAQYAIGQASQLSQQAVAGQGGLLIKAVIGIAAIGGAAWVLSGIDWSDGKKGSKA